MEKLHTELIDKIYPVIQSAIYKYYDNFHIEYKENIAPEDAIVDFFSYLYRQIPQKCRKVHYSRELSEKIDSRKIPEEQIDILKRYEQAFIDAENMNVYLSTNTTNSREPDFLLYTWHLYHLHLSDKIFSEHEIKKENCRSEIQLLCIIDSNDVYFVDVIKHPSQPEEYFNCEYLKIIQKNGWMEHIGFSEMEGIIPGSLKPQIQEDSQIFKLYSKCAVNIAFEFEGKAYAPLIEGIVSTRRPCGAVEKLIEINRLLMDISETEETYFGFEMSYNSEGEVLGTLIFLAPSNNIKRYQIFNSIQV